MQPEDDGAADAEEVEYDEHVWTSPRNAKKIAQAIGAELSKLDPANADFYRTRTAAYAAQLDQLDADFVAAVKNGKRNVIVFGDRFPFRYFVDAYGLQYFAAFPGCSTETEASAKTVAFLIRKVRDEKIPVVFHLEMSNEKMADTIAEAAGAKKLRLHACHNISKKEFLDGVSYLDLMRQNLINLREALK
jgi:zinc transport system substrate-binding protein